MRSFAFTQIAAILVPHKTSVVSNFTFLSLKFWSVSYQINAKGFWLFLRQSIWRHLGSRMHRARRFLSEHQPNILLNFFYVLNQFSPLAVALESQKRFLSSFQQTSRTGPPWLFIAFGWVSIFIFTFEHLCHFRTFLSSQEFQSETFRCMKRQSKSYEMPKTSRVLILNINCWDWQTFHKFTAMNLNDIDFCFRSYIILRFASLINSFNITRLNNAPPN